MSRPTGGAAGSGLALLVGLTGCHDARRLLRDAADSATSPDGGSHVDATSRPAVHADLEGIVLLEETRLDETCAMQAGGSVWCWNLPSEGAFLEARVATSTVQLAIGGCMACSRTEEGQVECCDHPSVAAHPARVPLTAPAVDLAVGGRGAPDWCSTAGAVVQGGKVASWKMWQDGLRDVLESALAGPGTQVSTDGSSLCAHLESNATFCMWNPNINPAKTLIDGEGPDGRMRVAPYLQGATQIVVRDMCVEGLVPPGDHPDVLHRRTRRTRRPCARSVSAERHRGPGDSGAMEGQAGRIRSPVRDQT